MIQKKKKKHDKMALLAKSKLNRIEQNRIDHDKYITTQEFETLTSKNFTARLKQSNFSKQKQYCEFPKNDQF